MYIFIMNKSEYLHVKLMEECNEVSMAVSKKLIFGKDSKNPFIDNSSLPNNQEKIIEEINDFLGIIELLIDNGDLPKDWKRSDLIQAKKEKVLRLSEYSKNEGCLK